MGSTRSERHGYGHARVFLEYRYETPFNFTGTLNKLTYNLQPAQLTAEEQRVMQLFAQRNNRASE